MEDNTKEDIQAIVNKKNTIAIDGFIKTTTAKMYDQQKEINQLRGNLSTLVEKMAVLEKQYAVLKVQTTGHGPTVA